MPEDAKCLENALLQTQATVVFFSPKRGRFEVIVLVSQKG